MGMRLRGVMALVLLAGSAGMVRAQNAVPARVVTLTESDRSRVVNLREGDTLEVRLPANASTGFNWTTRQRGDDVLVQKNLVHQQGAKNAPGAGGTDVWTFEATKTGRLRLSFLYRREWEKDVAPARTIHYSIVVQRR